MDKKERLQSVYDTLLESGIVNNKKEFAKMLGSNYPGLVAAMSGNERYLTDSIVARAVALLNNREVSQQTGETLLVIPTGARAGTLGDFADSVAAYDCERMVSPVRGADYAMQITGDSMSPEYPSGSQIIIKKVNEKAFIEWGKVYVLDTENGAVVKQVRKTDNPDRVECVSLNPAYQPFEINCKDIRGWYRVLMVLALK